VGTRQVIVITDYWWTSSQLLCCSAERGQCLQMWAHLSISFF